MSLNNDKDLGAGGMGSNHSAALAQAPRLSSGGIGYAAWRTNMEVHLQRIGAESIHSVAMQESKWLLMSSRAAAWKQEALDDALALVLGEGSSSCRASSSTSSSNGEQKAVAAESSSAVTASGALAETVAGVAKAEISESIKAGRKIVASTVERAHRVFGVIYSALPDELKAQAAHIAQGWAYGLWHWLETKFQSTEEDSVGELLGQWSSLRQEEVESFDSYRARVNKLHALLVHAKEKPSDRMYAHTLLDRLQPRYKAAVLALKTSERLKDAAKIDWDSVAAFINTHEREEARIDGEAAVAMAARSAAAAPSGAGMAAGAWKKPPAWSKDAGAHASSSSAGSKKSSGTEKPRRERRPMSEIECFECGKLGHFARNCPNAPSAAGGSSSSKQSGGGQAFHVGEHRQERSREASEERQQAKAVLSRGSGNRFVPLGDSDREEHYTVYNRAYAVKSTESRVAPKTKAKGSRSKLMVKKAHSAQQGVSDLAWGVDTMASLHVSGNRALFTVMEECTPQRVEVADGSIVESKHIGSILLSVATSKGKAVTITVKGVHYHPRFSANLLSMNVLLKLGWELRCSKEESFVLTPQQDKVRLSTAGRVSVMKSASQAGKSGSARRRIVYALGTGVSRNVTALKQLHDRLGHMGFDRMMRLTASKGIEGIPTINASKEELEEARLEILDCPACTQAKGTRSAFGHRGLDKGTSPGETLHMDTFQVPMEREGKTILEYGLAVTDPFTSHRWFEKIVSKDKGAEAVIKIVRNAQTQLNCRVKRLYADGGGEFINQTLKGFCAKEGIELHHSPARTQQLNGVAENSVRVIKDGMRAMLIQSWAPARLWAYAGQHGVYVWNRTHVSSTTGKTPYEMIYGKKPSMRAWGVWGCDAYYHVPKEQRDVFAPKMDPCIYVGHDPVQNCSIVYVLRGEKFIRTRDVSYREDSFKHAAALTAGAARVLDLLGDGGEAAGGFVTVGVQPSPAESDEAAPQGGNEIPAAVATDEESNEYEVDHIVAQRKHRQHGQQYLVHWTTNEQTWEPADMMAEDAPDAVRDFLAANPAPAGPRRSARNRHEAAAAEPEHDSEEESESKSPESRRTDASSAQEADLDAGGDLEEPEPEAQVHMAMAALKDLALTTMHQRHVPTEQQMAFAVSSGVALLEEQTPRSLREINAMPASEDKKRWRAGMDKEFDSCISKKVWTYVRRADVPRGKVILDPKWVFKTKTNELGEVTQHKARITPRGFQQKAGSDYFDVFARTGMYKSMRFNISLAAKWDHELDQLDVPVAFLNADVEEEIYMEVPEGYRDGKEHLVCRLSKALYGLKQSPRNWFLMISAFIMEKMNFKSTVSDPCLFFRRSRTGRLMLLFLFVDDFQVSYHHDDKAEWNELKALLVGRFEAKDMGPSKWILGMRITRNRAARTIDLDQELYITKALEKYGLAECKVADTPEVVGAAQQEPSDQQRRLVDRQRYMEIVGTLMYAAISSRLDIAHAVHYLACFMLEPTELHMAAAERVLRYLAGTKEVGLRFGSRNGDAAGDSRGRQHVQVDICAFSDADWANNKVDRKSVTGWVAKLNGDPVSWASKKQRTVALSSCESELYAKAAAIQEVLWLRGLAKELGLHTTAGTVHGDNQSAIAVAKNGIKGERTKHVDVKYHFVTESVERGEVQLKWVSTHEQRADIFTKALAAPLFHQFRKQLMTR